VIFAGGSRAVWFGVGDDVNPILDSARQADQVLAPVTGISPGRLGGVARCAQVKNQGTAMAMCVWQDHGTIGLLLFTNRTLDEAGVLLRAMRPELEQGAG
jgi:hypothetical protein